MLTRPNTTHPLHLLVLLLDLGGDRRHQQPRLPRLLAVLPLGVLQRRAGLPELGLDAAAAAAAAAATAAADVTTSLEQRRREGLGPGGQQGRRRVGRGDGGGDRAGAAAAVDSGDGDARRARGGHAHLCKKKSRG